MPDLQSSPHSGTVSVQGRQYDVCIHRLEGEPDWVLEIVDEHNTSHCFEERYGDDADALAAARHAIEAGECVPLDPVAGDVQAAFVRVAGCDGLAHPAAYALGYFTAALTLPPPQHPVRVFTAMLDPDAEMADLESTTKLLGGLYVALTDALEAEAVDLSHLGAQGLADWAHGYMAYVEADPRWVAVRHRGDELAVLESFTAAGFSDLPEAFASLAEAHDALEEAATIAFASWDAARQADLGPAAPQLEPFRHEGSKVGRNEPCPCGSGKKYKKCCLRT